MAVDPRRSAEFQYRADEGETSQRQGPSSPRSTHGLTPWQKRAVAVAAPRTLGWLSVALGLGGLFVPRTMARWSGLSGHESLLAAVGARELVSGIGLLTQRDKVPWLWARVAGDALDLAILGLASAPRGGRGARAAGTAVVAAITAADVAAAIAYPRTSSQASPSRDVYLERSIIVNKPPRECYDWWRDLRNMPRFTRNLEKVTPLDENNSLWVSREFAGTRVEWRSRINEDVPGERILWSATRDSSFAHAGSVTFAPATGGRGALIRVSIHYHVPGGRIGAALAQFLGPDPMGEVRENLRRFKQLLETGEIATTVGQPSGSRSLLGRWLPEGRKPRQPGRANSNTFQAEGKNRFQAEGKVS
jgi:uncharacterized membrane protein